MQALRWVRDNIEAFGGDPGQCRRWWADPPAAAPSAAMMTSAAGPGLFRRAILQSPGMGRPSRGASEAAESGGGLRALRGVSSQATKRR